MLTLADRKKSRMLISKGISWMVVSKRMLNKADVFHPPPSSQ